jgi:hypothetical protein
MNAELRRRVLATFESGTVEELAVCLALVALISIYPKTREAGPEFPYQTGSAPEHEQTMFGGK